MDGPFPAFDVQAPLMSLPHIFQTTPDTVPARIPYLFADAGRVEALATETLPATPYARPAIVPDRHRLARQSEATKRPGSFACA